MPATLAIQGEWGSGKTSLMNQAPYKIYVMTTDEDSDAPYYGVWINTLHCAMLPSPEETLINVMQGVTAEILEIMRQHKNSLAGAMSKMGGMFGKIVKADAKGLYRSSDSTRP